MRRKWQLVGLSVLALIVLWWFGRGLDWGMVRGALRATDWRLVAVAVGLVCSTYVIRSFRWRALLTPLAAARFADLFAATTVGFGAIFAIGRTGEILRPAFLSFRDRRVSPTASFVTIGLERIYDMAAIVLMFAANLLWFAPSVASAQRLAQVHFAGAVLFAGAVIGIGTLILFRFSAGRIVRVAKRASGGWPRWAQRTVGFGVRFIEQSARALSVLVDGRALAITVGWTALLWAAIAAADLLVLRAFGLPFGIGETIFVMGWALVGSLVPTPGGAAGAFHAATAAGLIFLGVGREQSAAVAIVMHLVLFGPALFFGLYFFLRSGLDLVRLWDEAAREAEEAERESSALVER